MVSISGGQKPAVRIQANPTSLASYGLTLLFPIAAAVYDWRSRGRVHPVYWWGLALIVLGVAARVVLLGSPAWRHAVQSLFG